MNDSAAKNGSEKNGYNDRESEWRELRELLTGPEHRQLDEILTRLDDPVRRAEELSEALPDAITLSRTRSQRLTDSLGPTIDTALQVSVRKNPKSIADAIFPVLGPALRKAISATLLSMVQSLNHVLNQSFSIQGFKWRIEALRTHKPFAEVVLLHTLVYQVEQIFLIHRHTGIVLQHVAAGEVLVRDPDLVSGMLTAIQDFVKDAFDSQTGEMLDTLRMGGDHSVWIEQGPEAYLAVVLRGTPPLELREDYRMLLAEIHETFQSKWEEFDGQVELFAMIQQQLENALTLEMRQPKQRTSPIIWLGVVTLLGMGTLWTWHLVEQQHQWRDLLTLLDKQSGIVVTSVRREWGRMYIEGLRDPLAADPQQLVAATGIEPDKVTSRWKPYQSLDPKIAEQRVRRLLQPSEKTDVRLQDGVLTVSGEADHNWLMKLHNIAPALVGVETVKAGDVKDIQIEDLRSEAIQLSQQEIEFDIGSVQLTVDQQKRMHTIYSILSAIQNMQQQFSIPVRVVIIGQSDPTGPERLNIELSHGRALQVMRFLTEKGIDPTMLFSMGKGSGVPPQQADDQQDLGSQRIVTFRIFIDGKEVGR